MAGELAAADLQLRRDPAGRRIAVRVRRPGREACDPHAGARDRSDTRRGVGPVSAEGSRHILVVANETAVSRALVDLIEEKAAGGDCRVTVLAPVNQPRQGYVV